MNISRFHTSLIALILLVTLKAGELPVVVTAGALAGLKATASSGEFQGFEQFDFKLPDDGSACKIVAPKFAASGSPWVWRARFFGHQPACPRCSLMQC